MSLGSYPTSSQVESIRFSLAAILASNTQLYYTESISSIALSQITTVSNTAGTASEGLGNLGSLRLVSYRFNTPIVPAGSTIEVSFTRDASARVATSLATDCQAVTGLTASGVLRCRVVSNTLVRI